MNRPEAYAGNEPYIFISYAHVDTPRIMPIISGLQERGFRVWYDAGIEPGTEYSEYIGEQVNGCGVLLSFMSANSASSRYCRNEIGLAIDLNKNLLVIYLEEVELSLGMRLELRPLQHMFYDRQASLDSFLDELCKSKLLASCRGDATTSTFAQRTPITSSTPYGHFTSPSQQYPQSGMTGSYPNMGNFSAGWPSSPYSNAPGMFQPWMNAAAPNAMWGAPAAPMTGSCEQMLKMAIQNPVLTERVRLIRDLADQGFAPAKTVLGLYYATANGVPKDMEKAISLYLEAAAMGDPEAHSNLADCYKEGNGVPVNQNLYMTYLQKAAELGYGYAQLDLGRNYRDGKNGFPKNKEKALLWFRKAAAQAEFPNTLAQTELNFEGVTW